MDKTQGFRLPKPPGAALPGAFSDEANLIARVRSLENYCQELHTLMQLMNRHVPAAFPGGGFDFSKMLDTNIVDPRDGELPFYDSLSKKWVNRAISQSGLGLNVVEIDGDYTVETGVDFILADCTSGNLLISLHAIADNVGHRVYIMRLDASGNAIDVDGDGSETINGSSGFTLSSQYDCALLVSGPNEWSRFV